MSRWIRHGTAKSQSTEYRAFILLERNFYFVLISLQRYFNSEFVASKNVLLLDMNTWKFETLKNYTSEAREECIVALRSRAVKRVAT